MYYTLFQNNLYICIEYYTLSIMGTDFNFLTKKRGKKGNGRATVFKAVQLPVDIIDELKLYRDVYGFLQSKGKDAQGNPIPEKVSFEQMLRRWMDNVDCFDPEAHAMVNSILRERRDLPPTYEVDPFRYPVNEFQYMFETDEGEVECDFMAGTFECHEAESSYNGLSLEDMYRKNFHLINDAGYEFSLEQAHELCRRLSTIEYDVVRCLDHYMDRKGLDRLPLLEAAKVLNDEGPVYDDPQKPGENLKEYIVNGALGSYVSVRNGEWLVLRSEIDWCD